MKVFFDTGAFIALFISQEKFHKQISNKYNDYRKQRALFYTSYYILDELFTRLIYDFGKSATEKVIGLLMKSIEKEWSNKRKNITKTIEEIMGEKFPDIKINVLITHPIFAME